MVYSDMFKRKMIQKMSGTDLISACALSKQVDVPQPLTSDFASNFYRSDYFPAPNLICNTQAAVILAPQRTLLNYLPNHREKMDYGTARRGGYHIGSGAIESANKFISHVRLKRSGAWWYETNANNILKLRCAKYNKTYDKIMELYKQSDGEQNYPKFDSKQKA
jgi:hypothetical protein